MALSALAHAYGRVNPAHNRPLHAHAPIQNARLARAPSEPSAWIRRRLRKPR
jgi:hypothetical protein